MARKLALTGEAWDNYLYWQSQDKKTIERINKLIEATMREPFEGIGKPEPLRENLGTNLKIKYQSAGSNRDIPLR